MDTLKDNFHTQLSLPTDRLVARFGILVSTAYLLKSGLETPWFSFPLVLGLLLGLMLVEGAALSRWFWAGVALVLSADLVQDYFLMPNHHFVLFYFCLVLFIVFSAPEDQRDRILSVNSRWLIAGIMFFGALQKALTPEYASGGFFGSMVLTGEFFKPGLLFFPGIRAVMAENKELLLQICATEPTYGESCHFIAPFPHLKAYSAFFAYAVVLGELLVALVFAFAESPKWRHVALFSIILSVFITRLETGFLSILCLLGIAHCPAGWLKHRMAYTGLILLFVSLIIIGAGFE